VAARGVGLRSLGEQIDTTSAAGRLVLHVFGALAEFERALMHERTVAGLAAVRARGRGGGTATGTVRVAVGTCPTAAGTGDASLGDRADSRRRTFDGIPRTQRRRNRRCSALHLTKAVAALRK
jgi:DNA invertase Pin-like site-specific DNA recombinase